MNPRQHILTFLHRVITCKEGDIASLVKEVFAAECVIDVAHPINRIEGHEALIEKLILPLRTALTAISRNDLLVLDGANRYVEDEGTWVSCLGHYVGLFQKPLAGIRPNGKLVFLRVGEFYHIDEDGLVIKGKVLIDFLDLLRQVGRFPIAHDLGSEMLFPAPATQDGIMPPKDAQQAEKTFVLVSSMLRDLLVFDPITLASKNQSGEDGYWHPQMSWYGPGGIGSTYTFDGFNVHHRHAFLTAFPNRGHIRHFCRITDGNYMAMGGWPSMRMTHMAPYMGIPPTKKMHTLRVMDFYRCENKKIIENWVLLDLIELAMQMDVDFIARAEELPDPA